MSPSRLLLVPFLIASLACQRKPVTPPDVVARVGERMITLADFKRYLERNSGTELAQLGPEVASAMLDQYVEEVILSEYAATHGVEVPADAIATAVRNDAGATVIEKRDEMRRQRLIGNLAVETPDPTDAQIAEYYNQHQNEFRAGEEVRVRQILVHEQKLADDIIARLKRGEPFEELSREHSSAPNAARGGEIGFVTRGDLPKMFEDEIFALQPGNVSNVIRTDASFHIFKVDERRGPGTVDLATAAPVIRARLKEDVVRDRVTRLVADSRRQVGVAVLTKRLPFRYSGGLPKAENE